MKFFPRKMHHHRFFAIFSIIIGYILAFKPNRNSFLISHSYINSITRGVARWDLSDLDQPVIKRGKSPVLTVIDPRTRTKIHLVGTNYTTNFAIHRILI